MNKLSFKNIAKFAICGLAAAMIVGPLSISAEEAQTPQVNTPGQSTTEKAEKPALEDLFINISGKKEDGVWQLPMGSSSGLGVFGYSVTSNLVDFYVLEWTTSDGLEVQTFDGGTHCNLISKKLGAGTVSVKITDKNDASKTKTLEAKVNGIKGNAFLTNTTDAVKTEDILKEINNGQVKEVFLTVNPEKTSSISADVFKAAKEAGIDLTIHTTLNDQNIVFTFKAADITNANIDLDLSVLLGAKNDAVTSIIPSEAAPLIVDFTHSGNLPGKATVSISMPTEEMYNTYKDSKELHVYHINEATGNLEKIENAIVTGPRIEFTITHCSQYVLTKTELADGQTKFADVQTKSTDDKKAELDAQPNTGV